MCEFESDIRIYVRLCPAMCETLDHALHRSDSDPPVVQNYPRDSFSAVRFPRSREIIAIQVECILQRDVASTFSTTGRRLD
jgi:hypothetical protein